MHELDHAFAPAEATHRSQLDGWYELGVLRDELRVEPGANVALAHRRLKALG
jgi:hypothetical protein